MKIIGHRGAAGLVPESTIASFKKALDLGVDMVEFDVHVTKDHIAIIHHNSTVIDDSGNKLKIAQSSYKELKRHKTDLAKLSEVLKLIDGRIPLYIEVKTGVDVGPVILELNHYKHEFLLASKSQKTLRKLHEAFPEVPKIIIEPISAIRAVWRAAQVNTRILSMNQMFLWPSVINKLSKRGYEVWAYPVNSPEKAKRWEKAGLAGIVTDFPDRFV